MEHAAPAFGFSSLQCGSTFPRNSSVYHTSLHTTNICAILCCLYIGVYLTLFIYYGIITISVAHFLLISWHPPPLQPQIYILNSLWKRSIYSLIIQPRNYIPLKMWKIYKPLYFASMNLNYSTVFYTCKCILYLQYTPTCFNEKNQ